MKNLIFSGRRSDFFSGVPPPPGPLVNLLMLPPPPPTSLAKTQSNKIFFFHFVFFKLFCRRIMATQLPFSKWQTKIRNRPALLPFSLYSLSFSSRPSLVFFYFVVINIFTVVRDRDRWAPRRVFRFVKTGVKGWQKGFH